jgi:peptidyl-prolyl cis-trans isomerase C
MKGEKQKEQNKLLVMKRSFFIHTFHAITGALALNISIACAESQLIDNSPENQNLAASVNGEPIEKTALSPQVDSILQKYSGYGIKQPNDEILKTVRMHALERLISAELIYQEAKKIKIDDLDERVTEKLNKIKEESEANKAVDERKMRKILTKQIMIDEYLVQQKLKDWELPEPVIIEYYEKNKDSFKHEEMVQTRHILVSVTKDAKPEEKENAYEKIKEARQLIHDGKPFGEIATNYSDCNSAPGGGELGYQKRGFMPQAYDDVAFALATDKLSDIIETEFGYHILEVLDRKSAGIQPYEEVRDFIAKYLNIQHLKKAMDDHLTLLRKKAEIDIYL